MKRTGSMWVFETCLCIWEEHVDEDGMYPVFRSILEGLEQRGFATRPDPDCVKNYPSLARTHWVGKKGDLEFLVELSGRSMKLEFFQNVVSGGNENGGRYDFGKFKLMPRRMQLQFIAEMTHGVRALVDTGYQFVSSGNRGVPLEASCLNVRDVAASKRSASPLEEFNRLWGSDRFERDSSGWPSAKELRAWPYPDGTGQPIHTGDTKYIRRGGRLQRCTVWPNMNGMWQVRYGCQVTYVSARELLSCADPDQQPRRFVPGQIERLQKELSKASEAKLWRRVAVLGAALERTARKLETSQARAA